jgi:hypothetical protein
MSVNDYIGIEGFCVEAKSPKDVYEALDRMHSQIMDEIEKTEKIVLKRSPKIAEEKIKNLNTLLAILENTMAEIFSKFEV